MTDAIPYEEMRRILGLPVRRTRISAPWAIRKLDAGVHAGHWGVWKVSGGTRELIDAHRTWTDAITDVSSRSDHR